VKPSVLQSGTVLWYVVNVIEHSAERLARLKTSGLSLLLYGFVQIANHLESGKSKLMQRVLQKRFLAAILMSTRRFHRCIGLKVNAR
jgi:hypothetical protein